MSNLKRGQESLGARGRGKKRVWARQRGAKGVRFKKKVARVAGTCRGFQQSGSRAWRVSEFQASLHKEHHASRDYTVRPCLQRRAGGEEEEQGERRRNLSCACQRPPGSHFSVGSCIFISTGVCCFSTQNVRLIFHPAT